MTVAAGEFIRRFLLHVLPDGFHRIRYYGLLASTTRAENIARARGTARGANPADRGHQGRQYRGRRTANTRAPLPLLRRPHDHHRGLRARLLTAISTDRTRRGDQDRHLMSASARPLNPNADASCRSVPGHRRMWPAPLHPSSHSPRWGVRTSTVVIHHTTHAISHPAPRPPTRGTALRPRAALKSP